MAQTSPAALPLAEPLLLPLTVPPEVHTDDAALFAFSAAHPEWRVERTVAGELILMAPASSETSRRNALITAALTVWAEQDGRGVAFDSSGGFRLPNGAVRSPDAAWLRRERLAALPAEAKRRFLPLCPDFVLELRSPTDDLTPLQAKMEEYRANGAHLGWLLDPTARRVYVYRMEEASVEQVDAPETLTADPVLPGFTLALGPVWAPGL